MPNTITKLEINDVLSSIRRLVSGEKVDRTSVELPKDDFFVLTPAHRIEDRFDDTESLSDLELSTEEPPVSEDVVLAPLELINPEFPNHFVKSSNTDAVNEIEIKTSAILMELFPETEQKSEVAALPQTEPTLEDRIAELEEAVGRSEGEWEPDGSEADTVQLPERHLFGPVDHSANWTESNNEATDTPVSENPEPQAKLANVPEFENQEPLIKLPLQLAEVATFTHVPRKSSPVEDLPSDAAAAIKAEVLDGEDDIFVDEDLLRRVVSDIVREELQGKLGERITRNIRRMVRREIEQSLQLKGFD